MTTQDEIQPRERTRYIAITNPKVHDILIAVLDEAMRAVELNAPMHSLHEGLSVIEEEVHELRLEVYKNPRKHPDRNALARKEAIQVAAMALRLLHDVL